MAMSTLKDQPIQLLKEEDNKLLLFLKKYDEAIGLDA